MGNNVTPVCNYVCITSPGPNQLWVIMSHLCVIIGVWHHQGPIKLCFTSPGPHQLWVIMSHPLGGGHIIFAFSGVRRPTWFPDILGNSSYPIFTKFGMQVYWVNSLYGIAFGDDSSIAN